MLVVEPAEPCIYNVRLHQAYRTTVTLRNDTRNALELTVRAGIHTSAELQLSESTEHVAT